MSQQAGHAVISGRRTAASGQWSVVGGQQRLAARGWLLVARGSRLVARRFGFTMAEVIFAIMILGIGLILLAAAFPVGIKQSEKSQDATNAALIAQHAYDQLTKVPAAGVTPDPTWAAVNVSSYSTATLPLDQYGNASPVVPGKALSMAFLDGAMSALPDLRVKLLYPGTLYHDDLTAGPATSPTWADDCPQHPLQLGIGAYTDPPLPQPVPFVRLWGFREEGGRWYENVQWAYPADRRYYWYAFYRQMNEGAYPHPTPTVGMAPWTDNGNLLLNTVRLDHITRRTFRVLVVVCKVARPFSISYGSPAKTLTLSRIEPPSFFQDRYGPAPKDPDMTPDVCMNQWIARNGTVPVDVDLAPIRIPLKYDDEDTNPGIQCDATRAWISDTAANGPITTLIRSGRLRRGGTVIDAWGNIYQIVDVTDNAMRIDAPLPLLPAASPPLRPSAYGYGNIRDALPLWLNPNAIAVFPTIVTKQADLP